MLGTLVANAIIGSLLLGFVLSLFDIDAKFTACLSEWFPKKHFKGNSTYYMIFFISGVVIGIINFFVS